ncbi:PAS domain S-box protein [Fodinicurvata halophila]|uniref:PAS domain S-box protein n=1 Tax=Fodinicurvata halophila TaxID=1419723 RepID=UPI003631F497
MTEKAMDKAHQLFFENHPDPIWIFDSETLGFLDVNQAAIHKLGYSRQEFLSMTIADIRAAEDVPALRKAVGGLGEGVFEGGVWPIYGAGGKRLFIDFHWRTIEFNDRKAILAAARDVTRVIELEQEREELLAREEAERNKAQIVAGQFQVLFESLPGKFLVLGPENFEIIAASDAYLEATRTRRDDIVGKNLFDVFGDDPATPHADAMRNMRASLERVKTRRRADVIAVQRYPIARPEDEGGGLEERYWSPLNAPVFAADGSLLYIVHRVEDVTGIVQERAYQVEEDNLDTYEGIVLPELEVLVRSRELKRAILNCRKRFRNYEAPNASSAWRASSLNSTAEPSLSPRTFTISSE